MNSKILNTIGFVVLGWVVFFLLNNIIPYGLVLLYPFKLMVTIFHEFGHASAAVITGGYVDSIKINLDGSGWCKTVGGNRSIILMGGYIGSSILGNFLLYVGFSHGRYSKIVLYGLCVMLLITCTLWSADLINSLLIVPFLILVALVSKTRFSKWLIMFIGTFSTAYIVSDYNVGPTSDIAAFAELYPGTSPTFWMYVWLIFALLITGFTVWLMTKNETKL